MTLTLNKRIWVLVERLYITCYDAENFLKVLQQDDIEYTSEIYASFGSTKGLYTFMSEENYTFAYFMELIPTYKYLSILQKIVFDPKIKATANDNWNYYGELIRNWYPDLIDLLKLAGVQVDYGSKKLTFPEVELPVEKKDYLPDGFGDIFLDYIRKEINEAYKNGWYLSVMFLSRKILEVTVVRVFEVVFPKLKNKNYSSDNHGLWYDTARGRYHNFETLLDNLKLKAKDFQEDEGLVIEFITLVRPFKDESNKNVHFDYKIPDEQYINQWRIPKIVGLARRLFRKYCNP